MSSKTVIIDYVAGHDISKITSIDQLPLYVREFLNAEMLHSLLIFSFCLLALIGLSITLAICARAIFKKTPFGCWEDGFPAFLIGIGCLVFISISGANLVDSTDWIYIKSSPIAYLMNL